MPSVSEQDSRHPLGFDWSVSAICWHVEQNLISADGIPHTETLNSPQRHLLRLKWKSNNVRFLWNFKHSCCRYEVVKFSKFNLYNLVRLNLSARKSADCIFLWRQCLTGGNGIEETKFAVLFLGPGTLPFLERFFFFLLFAGCVLQSLERIYICVRQRYWNIRSGGFDFRVKRSTLETRWIFYKDEWVYFPLTAIANISVLLCRKRILACFIIPHSVATKWRLIWAWEQMKAQMPFTGN